MNSVKKNWCKCLPLILLAVTIGLSPRIPLGDISSIGGRVRSLDLRLEDFVIVILVLGWLVHFLVSGKKKIQKTPLSVPIFIWLSISFISLLMNLILENVSLGYGFLYLLKEIEFFLFYFFAFAYTRDVESAKLLVKIWLFLGLINTGWIIYEQITGLKLTYFYGPTSFIEPSGPYPSGGFFLMIFIFFTNILIFYFLEKNISAFKKIILTFICVSPAIGVLAAGARTSVLGLVFSVFLMVIISLLQSLRRGNITPFYRIIGISILALGYVILNGFFAKTSLLGRAFNLEGFKSEYITGGEQSRIYILQTNIQILVSRPWYLFLGYGVIGERHSQYMRVLLERGVIGSIVFFLLIFTIIRLSARELLKGKDNFSRGLSGGLFISTMTLLVMSIPHDAFMVVKVAETYWFFVGLTLAVLYLNKEKEHRGWPSPPILNLKTV